MTSILSIIARFLYRLMGWRYDQLPTDWTRKSVVIGFPHTSNMDTVRALSYMKIIKVPAKLLVKAEWFFFPISILLRMLGGMPIKREKACGFVDSVVKEFKSRDDLVLALVPEGTRKKVSSIKTGFWYIAKGAQVPIFCWYLDNRTKRSMWVGKIIPGDSLEEDLLKIKAMYEKSGYTIPLEDIDKGKILPSS